MAKQQDDTEKRNDERINSMHDQLSKIRDLLQTSSPGTHQKLPPTHLPNSSTKSQSQEKHPCELCGITFNTQKAMNTHRKQTHSRSTEIFYQDPFLDYYSYPRLLKMLYS